MVLHSAVFRIWKETLQLENKIQLCSTYCLQMLHSELVKAELSHSGHLV